ncbi:VOC family protein [Gordonia sp. X0973]|uniref:VOC family protein n=1 Tax=Gordonia sp. X0973 TaxID=2742602 RepID=UPI000F534E67|nr:VOC family protein [Gordonia sp. X0973]QKT07310.1 VOC family protein [Gordonia sp. X0973]
MQITSTAISLNVDDPGASAAFLADHIGHRVAMEADGFVSLEHPDGGPNVIYLKTGLATFKPKTLAGSAGEGLLLVFVVDDVDTSFATMRDAGAAVVTEPETEPWGERYCQFRDPNGIVVQLVQWV